MFLLRIPHVYIPQQKLVSSPNVKKEDFKQTLQQAMKEKGLDTKLRNTVFHWVRTQTKQNVSLFQLKDRSSNQIPHHCQEQVGRFDSKLFVYRIIADDKNHMLY